MDGIVRFFNSADGGRVDMFEHRERIGNIVSGLIIEEDRTQAELDLAGNKIKRIHNVRSIACDVSLAFVGTVSICAGVVLNLTSVVFCSPSDWDYGAGSEDRDITSTAIGTSLCTVGGVMFGTGASRLWKHIDRKAKLDKEKSQIEARLAAINQRNVEGTEENAEHTANVQQLVTTAMTHVDVGMPPMADDVRILMPPPYSETPQNGDRVRRQLFSPQELPSISELPEYGEHVGDRLLETGRIPR